MRARLAELGERAAARDVERAPRHRMVKLQAPRVKQQALGRDERPARRAMVAYIDTLADERVPGLGELDAHLMRAPRHEHRAHPRRRQLARLCCAAAPQAVAPIPHEDALEARLGEDPMSHEEVRAHDVTGRQEPLHALDGARIAPEHEQPRGPAIDAVREAERTETRCVFRREPARLVHDDEAVLVQDDGQRIESRAGDGHRAAVGDAAASSNSPCLSCARAPARGQRLA